MSDQNLQRKVNRTDEFSPEARQRTLQLLREMLALHVNDIDCETCGENMDCLAELVTAGEDPKKVLPAIYAHLRCCGRCHEEFTALVAVLKAQQCGDC
jgi:hypothetical protein